MAPADQSSHNTLKLFSDPALGARGLGVIRLDGGEQETLYNRFESERAGLSPERALGRPSLDEVAPCTDSELVRGPFEGAEVDETFDSVFTLRMRVTPVRRRLIQRAEAGPRPILVPPQ